MKIFFKAWLLACCFQSILYAGQNIVLTSSYAYNFSVTAQSHSQPVEFQALIANISNPTADNQIFNASAVGMYGDYSDTTHLRIYSNWETTGSLCTIPINLFSTGYIYIKYRHDSSGAVGPALTDYCEAWDSNGVLQFTQTSSFTDNPSYNNNGIIVGGSGNASQQSVGFLRSSIYLTPLGSHEPATADASTYTFHYKFDNTLNDSSGNGWTLAMNAGSASYEPTLYQIAIANLSISTVTWRAGFPQSLSGVNSFSQADNSSAISTYFWQSLSGPTIPTWSSNSASVPVMSGLLAGDYQAQLTITDLSANSAVAIKHIGVVATDNNDIVINSTAMPTQAQTDIILGPLQKWESPLSAYPLFDVLHALQWTLRQGDFNSILNGASSFNNSVAFFDYAQPGTLTATQTSFVLQGQGTNWLTTVCDAGDNTNTAAVFSSTSPWPNPQTFVITSANNSLSIAFDGGTAISTSIVPGTLSVAQIASAIQSVIGSSGTASPDYVGYLLEIKTKTVGTAGSVAVNTVANSIYSTIGMSTGTFTVANMPQPAMEIIPWYPFSSVSNPIASTYPTGRRQLNVVSCLSNTQMIVEQANGIGWRLPTATNIQFAIDSQSWGNYEQNQNNGNYYDNVLADYYKAFKSGVASDLTQARARADRWFRCPISDAGQEYAVSNDGTGFQGSGHAQSSRLVQMSGVMLRALDGQPNYWPGLDYILLDDVAKMTTPNPPGISLDDIYVDQREFGYALQRVSLCSLFDVDTSTGTSCRLALVTVSSGIIRTSLDTTETYPYFPSFFGEYFSFNPGGTSVCLVNGSTTATFTGTNFSTIGNHSTAWFFPTPSVRPATNLIGDTTYYLPTVTDATHMNLGRAYTGTTACTGTSGSNAGYAIFDSNNDVPYIGWGAQPFMEGLMGAGMAMASKAVACTSAGVPSGCDNTQSANLITYAADVSTWMANAGYQPISSGVYQGAGFVNCNPPSSNSLCSTGNLPYGARVVAEEADGGISEAYRLTGNPNFKALADNVYNASWSNSGGLPDYNPPSGGYTVPDPGNGSAPKYYGLMAGISRQPSYQAVALCSSFPCVSPLASAVPRTINIGFNLPANATTAQVNLIEPDGYIISNTCTVSPCAVQGDARQGSHLIQIQYLSSGGSVVASSDKQVQVVQ